MIRTDAIAELTGGITHLACILHQSTPDLEIPI